MNKKIKKIFAFGILLNVLSTVNGYEDYPSCTSLDEYDNCPKIRIWSRSELHKICEEGEYFYEFDYILTYFTIPVNCVEGFCCQNNNYGTVCHVPCEQKFYTFHYCEYLDLINGCKITENKRRESCITSYDQEENPIYSNSCTCCVISQYGVDPVCYVPCDSIDFYSCVYLDISEGCFVNYENYSYWDTPSNHHESCSVEYDELGNPHPSDSSRTCCYNNNNELVYHVPCETHSSYDCKQLDKKNGCPYINDKNLKTCNIEYDVDNKPFATNCDTTCCYSGRDLSCYEPCY